MISKSNFFRKTSLNKKITFPRKVKSKSNMISKKEKKSYLFENKKAQVTIFIILAIIIIAVIGLFFVFRDNIFQGSLPQELEPVYSYYFIGDCP